MHGSPVLKEDLIKAARKDKGWGSTREIETVWRTLLWKECKKKSGRWAKC
jgi:hypothetical protein